GREEEDFMAPALRGVRRSVRLVPPSLVVLLILISSSTSMAQSRKISGVTFTLPAEWNAAQQGDGLTRIVSPDGNAMIIVMPGDKCSGDLNEGFKVTWDSLRQGLGIKQVVSGGEPQAGKADARHESVS